MKFRDYYSFSIQDLYTEEIQRLNIPAYALKRAKKRARSYACHFTNDMRPLLITVNSYCVVCNSNESLELDHIIPIIKGGANTQQNLQILCCSCNRAKGGKTQAEFMAWRANANG